MDYFSIDYLIVYAFLIITLIIGLRAGRGIKDIREYALANRGYSTGALVLTKLATTIGGAATIIASAEAYSHGVIMTAASMGIIISVLFVAFFVAPRMKYFSRCLTIGDMMAQLYGGNTIKIIAGSLGVVHSTIIAGLQLFVLGIICDTLLGVDPFLGIVLGGIFLGGYVAVGGIRAVTATDIFQFLILIIIFPIICSIAVKHVGGLATLFAKVPQEKLLIRGHEQFYLHLTLFLTLGVFSVGITVPPLTQRLLMAKDGRQIRNQHLIVAFLDPAFRILVMLIGLAALVAYPNINSYHALPHIVNVLLPVSIKGFAIAGLIAVVMSTADSHLHAAGLLLSHDVIAPLRGQSNKALNEITLARLMTLLLCLATIYIGLHAQNILSLSLMAMRVTGPLIIFPFVTGILGLKVAKQDFFFAFFSTIAAFALCALYLPPALKSLDVTISILVNGITFLAMHIIRNKGFAILNQDKEKI